MKRGWILFWSVLIELVVFVAVCLASEFLPISIGWKILVVFSGIAGMVVLGFCLIYFWWAPNNLYFTFVHEGRAKAVMEGDAFQKILIQWQGFTLSSVSAPDGSEDIGDVIEMPLKKSFFGGLKYYGFWPIGDMYIYSFGWTDILENGEVQPHLERMIDYIVLKTTLYHAKVSNAEDKQELPLDIDLILTVRIINPYKALFRTQNWLEFLINTTKPAVRDVITKKTYDEWIQKKGDLGESIFKELGKKNLISGFKKEYGIALLSVGVRDINPGTDFRDVTVKKVTAEKNKEATIIDASAEQARIETVYQTVQKFGHIGQLIRALEALEKSPGAGAKWVVPLPGFTDLLSAVFPGRSPESLQPDEIKQLREVIKKST